jgi:hypothetical protein
MLYVVYLLNHTATESLDWRTPIERCIGITPDISPLLQFAFYEQVYFKTPGSFPDVNEELGWFVGIAENIGDALTFWVLTASNQVLARSLVRSASNPQEPNLLADRRVLSPDVPDGPGVEGRFANDTAILEDSFHFMSDTSRTLSANAPASLHVIDPIELIGRTFIHDSHGIPTKSVVREYDAEMEKVLVEHVSGVEEWLSPNIVEESLISQTDDGEGFWSFEKILQHRVLPNGRIELNVLWDNGESSWEPLIQLRKDDPITVAQYAMDNELLDQRGWKWAKKLVDNG